MSTERHRVLVAEELRYFAERADRPADIEVDWIAGDDPTPGGRYAGILPLLSRGMDAAAMDRLRGLRVIANYAVGYDNIDLAAARSRGIAVGNTPDVLTEATADLTWALILAVARRLREAETLVREGEWEGWHPTLLLGTELGGRRLGILGAGRIGRAVGRRAVPFGMEITYWSRSARPDWEADVGARRIGSLSELLAGSDVVSVHLPLTAGTRGLIDRAAFERMREGAVVINTARGGIVDEDALCDALESGRLGGAGLDVFENEPEIDPRLKRLPGVVLLPHVGSATEETRRRMFELAWENLIRGVRGRPLAAPVVEAGG